MKRFLLSKRTARHCLVVAAVTVSLGMPQLSAQQGGSTGSGTTGSGGSIPRGTTGSGTTGGSATGSTGSGTGANSGGTSTLGLDNVNVSNAPQGFIGGNTTQQTGFVGSARESTLNSNNNRQFRAINDQMANQNLQSQQTGTPRSVPFALRLGFPTPTPDLTTLGFSPINAPSLALFTLDRPELAGVQVAVSQTGVATLSGVANNSETRRLAANLIRLQPGIRSIDDQIVVANADIPSSGVASPLVPSPGVLAPSVPAPGVPAPEALAPVVPAPGVPSPGVPSPGVPSPGVPSPDVSGPEIAKPAVPSPNIPKPEISKPAISKPEISKPVVPKAVVPKP